MGSLSWSLRPSGPLLLLLLLLLLSPCFHKDEGWHQISSRPLLPLGRLCLCLEHRPQRCEIPRRHLSPARRLPSQRPHGPEVLQIVSRKSSECASLHEGEIEQDAGSDHPLC